MPGCAPPSGIAFDTIGGRTSEDGVVCGLARPGGARRPVAFVKLARSAGDRERLRHAHDVVRALRERGGAWAQSALPRPVCLAPVEGWLAMVSEACIGPTLSEEVRGRPWLHSVRRQAAGHLREVTGWLIRLSQTCGERRALTRGDLDRHVLARLRVVYGDGPLPASAGTFVERLTALEGQDVPIGPVHNDLNPRNVIVGQRSGLCVVDWEASELEGLPFVDLFYFTTWYFRHHRRLRPRDRAARFRAAYWGTPWYRDLAAAAAATYAVALGIDLETAEACFPLHVLHRAARSVVRGLGRDQAERYRSHFEQAVGWSLPAGVRPW